MDQLLREKKQGKTLPTGRQARILVAPLDWGLGHATRCIPVIRELLAQGCEVWLAGEGAQIELLKTEFPQLPFLQLEGYRVRYSRSATGFLLSLFRQTHKIIRAIKKENGWLKQMIAEHNFDAVISDNRYGLYHKKTPCIFITHQLNIKSPSGKWTEKILQKRNYKYINRFTECWVPDLPAGQAGFEEENNLAGELSHPGKKPVTPVHYIGSLSRFQKQNIPEQKNHLLIILSGPEPQRSILEDKVIKEISHYNGTAVIVRGIPGSASLIPSTNMIHFYNHLPSKEMNEEILKAEYVISRSGYSTVMDIMTLQKKSILIPTPGQTEQEYLGEYLMKKRMAVSLSQNEFSLNAALSKANQFNYHLPQINHTGLLEQAIHNFITSLRKPN